MDSFEFTLPDSSYVALIGDVGGQSVPLNFMTRSVDASGNLRVHVDIQSIKLIGTLPIQITLLSAKTGAPVCAAVVSASVGSGPVQHAVPAAPSSGPVSNSTSYPSYSDTSAGEGMASGSGSQGSSVNPAQGSGSPSSAPATTALGGGVVRSVQETIGSLCTGTTGPYRLWLVLLILYVLLVGVLLWAEWPLSWAWARMPEWISAGVLVPLVLLLAFWYFSVGCRATWWIPLIAIVIAITGLMAAFWDNPRVARILLLEGGDAS